MIQRGGALVLKCHNSMLSRSVKHGLWFCQLKSSECAVDAHFTQSLPRAGESNAGAAGAHSPQDRIQRPPGLSLLLSKPGRGRQGSAGRCGGRSANCDVVAGPAQGARRRQRPLAGARNAGVGLLTTAARRPARPRRRSTLKCCFATSPAAGQHDPVGRGHCGAVPGEDLPRGLWQEVC